MSSVRSFRHRWTLQQLILDPRERKTSLSALFSQSVLSTDKNRWHMRHGPAQTSTENEICPTYAWITVGWDPFCNRHVRTLSVAQHCCGTLLYVFDTANVEHSLQTLAYEIGLIYLIYMSVHKRFAFLREGLRVCVYPALYFHAGNLLQFKSKMESQWKSATDLSTDLCQAVLRVTSLLKLVHKAAREHPWDHSGLQSCVH